MNTWKRNVLKALKEVPIFYKIVIANTVMAGTVIGTLLLFGTEAVAFVVVLTSGVVNALLVGAALKVDGIREQQRNLFAWSLNEAERERGRVANEIRESAAQRLAALLLVPSGQHAVAAEAAAVMQELVKTAETLQPPRFELLGLSGALAFYGPEAERRLGLTVRISVEGPIDELEPKVGLVLYRMLEDVVETLAGRIPEGIDLRIAAHGACVTSSIRSFGTPAPCADLTSGEAFRLKERAACLGGRLDISSAPDGMSVRVITPIMESHARYDSRLAG